MIFYAADLNRMHPIRLGDSRQICPDPFLELLTYPMLPILGAEDKVVMQRGIRVGHWVQSSLRDEVGEEGRVVSYRGLKPTVTIIASLSDGENRRNVMVRRRRLVVLAPSGTNLEFHDSAQSLS